MAVEEIEKLVDAPFVFAPKKIKETVFRTSDRTEFRTERKAKIYDAQYLLMKEFKEYFSEEKNNFRIGTKELNNSLWMAENCYKNIYDD